MTSGIRPIVNFFIYSSLVISLAASTFALETFVLLDLAVNFGYLGLVFFATLLTYSIHRIVGIRKLDEVLIEGRFKVIRQYESHIIIYTIISIIAIFYFLSQLPNTILYYLSIPALISGLYTVPLFSKSKRLRDFDYIKILLIALTWASVALIGTVNYEIRSISNILLFIIFLEKSVYIFAITLPFDIRDDIIDKHSEVKTFPALWGHHKTYTIINICLIFSFIMLITIGILNRFSAIYIICVLFSFLISIIAVRISKNKQSDLYYSGLLDGVIILRSVAIMLGCYFQ